MRHKELPAIAALLAAVTAGAGITLHRPPVDPFQGQIPAGDHPNAVALDDRRGRAVVINSLSGGHGVLTVIDIKTGSLLRAIPVGDLAVGPAIDERAGRTFVATQGSPTNTTLRGDLERIEITTGRAAWTVPLPQTMIPEEVAVDQQSGHVFVAGGADAPTEHGLILMFDGASGALLRSTSMGRVATGVVANEPGGHVLVTGYNGDGSEGLVGVLDAKDGQLVRTYKVGMEPYNVVVDTNLEKAFTANRDSTVTMLDLRAAIAHNTLANIEAAKIVVAERAGHAFLMSPSSSAVEMLSAANGSLLRTVTVGLQPMDIAADNRSGQVLVVNAGSNTVSVLDAYTGTVLRTIATGPTPVAIAINEQSGQAVVVDNGESDPQPLPEPWWHRFLPWLSPAKRTAGQGSVSVFPIGYR